MNITAGWETTFSVVFLSEVRHLHPLWQCSQFRMPHTKSRTSLADCTVEHCVVNNNRPVKPGWKATEKLWQPLSSTHFSRSTEQFLFSSGACGHSAYVLYCPALQPADIQRGCQWTGNELPQSAAVAALNRPQYFLSHPLP